MCIRDRGSWGVSWGFERVLGNNNFLFLLLELGLATASALIIFILIAMQFKLPELDLLTSRIRQKIRR